MACGYGLAWKRLPAVGFVIDHSFTTHSVTGTPKVQRVSHVAWISDHVLDLSASDQVSNLLAKRKVAAIEFH